VQDEPVSELEQESFQRWYTALDSSPTRDELVREWLDLPDGITPTGLVGGPGFAAVIEALALTPGDLLLDLACGRGSYGLAAVRATGARLVGVDFAPAAVAAAEAAAAALGLAERATFRRGDLTATDLEDASVDAVMCLDSLQFAVPTAAAVQECRRVLVPGGRLVLTAWEAATADRERLPERIATLDVEAELRQAGFTSVSVTTQPGWLELERRHWERAVRLDVGEDEALQTLREEGEEVLPLLPLMRRVLAVAVAPPAEG
jgi:SAM-dependent methyltransferase